MSGDDENPNWWQEAIDSATAELRAENERLIQRIDELEAAGRELVAAATNRTCPAHTVCWCKEDAEARWTKAEKHFNTLLAMSTPSTDAGERVDETEEREHEPPE